MSEKRVIKLVCTNLGKHEPRWQHKVTVNGPLDFFLADPDRFAAAVLVGSGEHLELTPCRECGRAPKLAAAAARQVTADALGQFAAGRVVAVVDISPLT